MSYRFHIIRLAGSRLTDEECTLAMPIHDVSETRGGMLKLGMLAVDYEGGDSPHMPVVVAYWTRCWEEPDFNEDFDDSPEGRQLQMWRPPVREGEPASGDVQPGIAYHKFYINGRRKVTADECREALAAWRIDTGSPGRVGEERSRRDED